PKPWLITTTENQIVIGKAKRLKRSKKFDCKWHVNLSNPEIGNYVYITLVHFIHNHDIIMDNARFAMAFQKFDESVMSEIERAVVYKHCDAYTIRNLLQPLFPSQLFLTQNLSNMIQKIKREQRVAGSDASNLLKFLLEQQKENPVMFVQPLINSDSNWLNSIFWMTANQVALWSRYSDVVLYDNTSRTNKYNFPLSLFILVDNDGKSRLEAQAFLSDETQESYEWVLQQTLDATSAEPRVIMTDMDPAIDAAFLYKCEKLDIDYAYKFDESDQNEFTEINCNQSVKNVDSICNEPFVSTSSQECQHSHVQSLIPSHHYNVQEVQVRYRLQKKMDYGRILDHFKKALNYSLEDDDQNNLDGLILSYIAKKEAMRGNKDRSAPIETQDSSCIKLSDGCVYHVDNIKDLAIRRGKDVEDKNNETGA
ncbi:13043_t:CDS:2, partial [Racocetra fulgida]